MIDHALSYLIHVLAEFFILLLLTRFYLQAGRISFKHPLGQFVLATTNWAVLPLRKVLPAVRRYDTASIVLAWLVALLMHTLLMVIAPWPPVLTSAVSIAALIAVAVLELAKMSLYLLFAATVIQALMSWMSPYNPLMPIMQGLTGPFLRTLHKIIPTIGGVDISPLILVLLIQLLLNVVVADLEPTILQYVRIMA
ncbi:YggT family protein [Silvimonas sp. JCM 19000]